MLSLPIAFRSAIGVFAPVFSRPVWQHVKVLMTGAVLAPGQRTVTAMLRIMGRSAGIVKLLRMIVSPGNRRYFPDVIATDQPFRRPALSP